MELGSSSIRFVKVEQSGPRTLEVPLGPDLYNEGQVVNRKGFSQAVRTALRQQLGSVPPGAAVSLGAQNVLVRRIGLPKLKGPALRNLLETQGEQWIPFLREGAAFDLVVVDPNMSAHQQEVLLVAVPTRTVERIAEAVNAMGLKLAALDVDTAALFRTAVASGAAQATGVVGMVDLTTDRPRIALYQNGYLVGTRTLDSRGVRGTTQWGAAGFNDDLPTDVRRSIDLMVTQLRAEAPLDAMVVLGAPPAELMEALDREFRLAMASRIAPGFNLTMGNGASIAPEAALGYGLALCQRVAPFSFDLMPKTSVEEKRQRNLAWLLSGVLVAGVGAYGYLWTLQMPELTGEEARLRRDIGTANAYLAREPGVKVEEARAASLQPIFGALAKVDPWTVAFPRLKEILPTGVRITSLSGALPSLSITGTAPLPEQVDELLNAMEKSPYFLNPVLSTSGTETDVAFSMSVQLAPREVKAK